MTAIDIYRIFKVEDILSLPSVIMELINGDAGKRNDVYRELLKLNNNDVSCDWFQTVYESEFAERDQKKQDFTPQSLGVLASRLTGTPKGIIHEPTAGSGGMIISDWWERCLNTRLCEFRPSKNLVNCWELSSRAIPILLLNLSIRGIMGYVYHGDVLEQKITSKYILLNRADDFLAFSEIIKVNSSDKIYNTSTNYDI